MERVRKKTRKPEDEIQRAIFKHFAARGAPGVFAFHPKNGGIHQRGKRAGINTGLGVVPGVPDVIAIKDSRAFALELKAPGGVTSDDQKAVIAKLQTAGATVGIAIGLDAALRWLEDNGLLQGRAA